MWSSSRWQVNLPDAMNKSQVIIIIRTDGAKVFKRNSRRNNKREHRLGVKTVKSATPVLWASGDKVSPEIGQDQHLCGENQPHKQATFSSSNSYLKVIQNCSLRNANVFTNRFSHGKNDSGVTSRKKKQRNLTPRHLLDLSRWLTGANAGEFEKQTNISAQLVISEAKVSSYVSRFISF